MKTGGVKLLAAVGISLFTAVALYPALANDPAPAQLTRERSYTGTVLSVDPTKNILCVKSWTMLHKTFQAGEGCYYFQLDRSEATLNDMRAGEKVTVKYQDAQGMPIASRVEQEPMTFGGTIKAIDNNKHTLTMHQTALDKQIQFSSDCKVTLRDRTAGTMADLKEGNHVTVTYETPDTTPTAREIVQTSIPYTGTLTAIDLDDKTVEAKTIFATTKFNVADHCIIVVNGRMDGKLEDLKPNEKLSFSYDEINGANVVNWIGPADMLTNSFADTTH